MNILIGADLVPTKSNFEHFKSGNVEEIFDEKILNVLKEADYRIFNLEVPLTDFEDPISKNGPNLIAPTSTIKGIKKLNPTLLTLANNHILDHGHSGLKSTVDLLKENNIDYIGAGNNVFEAAVPYIIENNSKKVGIYNCAEHEFTIATDCTSGANPFDPLESLDHISELKKKCDFVIVLYHGGREYYRYPSPKLQKVCRKICDKGADLVICQHSHCVGCKEEYKESTIVYGQGNFCFDAHSDEFWDTAMLINVLVDEILSVEYIPIEKKDNKILFAKEEKAKGVISCFEKRNSDIKKPGFIEKEYDKMVDEKYNYYMSAILGKSIIFRIKNKLSGHKLKRNIDEETRNKFINYLECEAHNECILKALKNIRSKNTL